MNRRSFLGCLASLPLLPLIKLLPEQITDKQAMEEIKIDCGTTAIDTLSNIQLYPTKNQVFGQYLSSANIPIGTLVKVNDDGTVDVLLNK